MVKLQENEIDKWAKMRLPGSTQTLHELASIDSATLKISEVAKVKQRLVDTFSKLGMIIDIQEQHGRGPLLVARTLASSPSSGDIALVGHADTVRDLDEELAPIVVEGDVMKGTGVYDMKAGLVVIIDALEALHKMGNLDTLPLRVIINSAEENPTDEIIKSMEHNLKGCSMALVFESGRPHGAVVVARKGIVEAEVTFEGRTSHAGNALWDGHNALVEAFKLGLKLDALKDKARGITCNPAKIVGGHAANAVPDKALLIFEARYSCIADYKELMENLKNLEKPDDPNIKVNFHYKSTLAPMECTRETEALFAQWRTAGTKAGFSLEMFPQVGGISDGNLAAGLGIPTLDALGPSGGGAHEKHEHVVLSSLTPKTLNLIYFLCERSSELRSYRSCIGG